MSNLWCSICFVKHVACISSLYIFFDKLLICLRNYGYSCFLFIHILICYPVLMRTDKPFTLNVDADFFCRWAEVILECPLFLMVRVYFHGLEQLKVEKELCMRVCLINSPCGFPWTILLSHPKWSLRRCAFIQMLISLATFVWTSFRYWLTQNERAYPYLCFNWFESTILFYVGYP